MRYPFRAVAATVVLGAWGLLPTAARAENKPVGWSATANLGAVVTTGNTETSSAALKARVEYNWLRTAFWIEGGGLRQDANEITRYAVGPDSFNDTTCSGSCALVETSNRSTKAEKYNAELGFERRITERFFWSTGGAYDRDLFSGVERKVAGRLGIGYLWSSRDGGDFKLGVQGTYTNQKEKVKDPKTKDTYAGVRLEADYAVKFGMTKQNAFQSKLGADENVQVTDDFRATWDNTITVTMTQRLALQVGTKTAFRNLPALQEVPLFASAPVPGASASLKTLTPFKKVDNTFQVSLVINWSPHAPTASRPTP